MVRLLVGACVLCAALCATEVRAQWGYGSYSYQYNYHWNGGGTTLGSGFGPGYYNPRHWGPNDYVYPTQNWYRAYQQRGNRFGRW